MTFREFLLLLLTVTTAASGQFLLKMGALKLGRVTTENVFNHLLSIVRIPQLMIGLALYGFSAMLFILLLTRVPLSVLGPSVAFGYVISVMLGYWVFKEPVPVERLVGLSLIVCGVILVIWKQ